MRKAGKGRTTGQEQFRKLSEGFVLGQVSEGVQGKLGEGER